MGKKIKKHYISDYYNDIFIVAETLCGKYWEDVEEFTSDKKEVTCKNCLKKLQ